MPTSFIKGNTGDNTSQPTSLLVVVAASMMALDLVKLEQRYLILYSVYTAHIGQGKEAAQVAMKHPISDLQEVVLRDAIAPPSLVAPTITINTVKHNAATLQPLAKYLSRAAKKSLLA